MLVKQNLSASIPTQIDQGDTVVAMSRKVVTKPELVDALAAANTDLKAKQAAALEAKGAALLATADARASALAQRVAFGNLASQVNTLADGSVAFIRSTGYGVRATPTPVPPITVAPSDLTTRINGVPGRVVLSWKGVFGARVYEVQFTTDLSGETGWKSVDETPAKSRIHVDGLTSGTKYAFRVRALANGQPGPWSGPVQQMAA
ncbi:MAG: fibronectin type III domain-containing protein [Verrucomicrobiota bacterium]|nr:fibronectin type III domain-containing protein [Verrucomicrobiota bacterium]